MDNRGLAIVTAVVFVAISGTAAAKIDIVHYPNIRFCAVQFYVNRATFLNVDAGMKKIHDAPLLRLSLYAIHTKKDD